jgi:hypothetical protein
VDLDGLGRNDRCPWRDSDEIILIFIKKIVSRDFLQIKLKLPLIGRSIRRFGVLQGLNKLLYLLDLVLLLEAALLLMFDGQRISLSFELLYSLFHAFPRIA